MSAGDRLKWMGPLHIGSFGGLGVKLLWSILSPHFPVLAISGTIMWCAGSSVHHTEVSASSNTSVSLARRACRKLSFRPSGGTFDDVRTFGEQVNTRPR